MGFCSPHPRTGPVLAGGSGTVLPPPHPHGAPSYVVGWGAGVWVRKRAGSGPYLGRRKGRQSPYDLGRGLLHPPSCGGSGAERNPGKVHSGNWSSRRGPRCAGTRCVSHLSGASHPTPLAPASRMSPSVSRCLFPRRLPRPGLSTGCPTSPAVPAGKGCGLGPRAAGGRVGSARLPRPRSAAGRGHLVLGRGQFPSAAPRRPPGPSPCGRRRPAPRPPRPAWPLTARRAAVPGTVGALGSSVRRDGARSGPGTPGPRGSRGRRLRKSLRLGRAGGVGRGGRDAGS